MDNTKLLTEAQMKAFEEIAEAVTQLFARLWEIIKAAAKVIAELWRTVIESYANKRIVHLALHHKDPKVRRKNMGRIMKWVRRYIRCRG